MCSPVSVIVWHLFESRLVEQGSVMAILQVILFGRIIAHLKSGAGNRSGVKRLLSKHSSTKKRQSKVYMSEFWLCCEMRHLWYGFIKTFIEIRVLGESTNVSDCGHMPRSQRVGGMVGLWCMCMVALMVRLLFSLIVPKQKGHPNGCPSNTLIKLLLTDLRWLHYFNSALMRMG